MTSINRLPNSVTAAHNNVGTIAEGRGRAAKPNGNTTNLVRLADAA